MRKIPWKQCSPPSQIVADHCRKILQLDVPQAIRERGCCCGPGLGSDCCGCPQLLLRFHVVCGGPCLVTRRLAQHWLCGGAHATCDGCRPRGCLEIPPHFCIRLGLLPVVCTLVRGGPFHRNLFSFHRLRHLEPVCNQHESACAAHHTLLGPLGRFGAGSPHASAADAKADDLINLFCYLLGISLAFFPAHNGCCGTSGVGRAAVITAGTSSF